jgi:hypothetical protein
VLVGWKTVGIEGCIEEGLVGAWWEEENVPIPMRLLALIVLGAVF